jgi:hypothetical protein
MASICRRRLQPDGHERFFCARHSKALEFGIYTATRSLSKCGLRAVSVAHNNPTLGLSSRQVRPKTPVSSRYCAIGPKQNHWWRALLYIGLIMPRVWIQCWGRLGGLQVASVWLTFLMLLLYLGYVAPMGVSLACTM